MFYTKLLLEDNTSKNTRRAINIEETTHHLHPQRSWIRAQRRPSKCEHELCSSFELIYQLIEIMKRANRMLEWCWWGGGRGVLQRAIAPTSFCTNAFGHANFFGILFSLSPLAMDLVALFLFTSQPLNKIWT